MGRPDDVPQHRMDEADEEQQQRQPLATSEHEDGCRGRIDACSNHLVHNESEDVKRLERPGLERIAFHLGGILQDAVGAAIICGGTTDTCWHPSTRRPWLLLRLGHFRLAVLDTELSLGFPDE